MAARDIPPASRRAVEARSGGRCEARIRSACKGRASHMHHIQRRELGDHSPANLLHVCGPGGCHDYIHARPAWSRDQGFIRSAFTPVNQGEPS